MKGLEGRRGKVCCIFMEIKMYGEGLRKEKLHNEWEMRRKRWDMVLKTAEEPDKNGI